MHYNFIKETYEPFLQNLSAGSAVLENFIPAGGGSFLLKHSLDALAELIKFAASADNNIFILNGFTGSGKTYTADCFLDFISGDVLVFRNSYQEAVNLDDVLLSIFRDFSIYHNENKVILPKHASNVFSEKINTYVKSCDAPMLFIFDSFDINMRSKESQKDILDFINYLSHFEKVKILICSRAFRQDGLVSEAGAQSFVLKPLTLDETGIYLKENGIDYTAYELEELFKASRGHYILLELSVMIMKLLKMQLSVFSVEYKNTAKNFLDFLVSKLLSSASEKYSKLLVLLSALRHGVPGGFLVNQYFASSEDISILLQKQIIAEKFGKYYLKDYIKNQYIKSINAQTKIKIHKYLIDVYEAELPLKPFDRELFLSRLTMRQEIAYHTKKIQDTENIVMRSGRVSEGGVMHNFKYISYARTGGFEPGMENKQLSSYRAEPIIKPQEKTGGFELSNEDSKLLNASKIPDISDRMASDAEFAFKQDMERKTGYSKEAAVPQSIDEYIAIARSYEDAFNFSSAVTYYKKALTYTNDAEFKEKEPLIYAKLALCFKKIQNTEEAVKCYEKVYNIYAGSNPEKAAKVLINTARIYSENYKFEKAREIYKRILNSGSYADRGTKIRVYLELSELEDSSMDAALASKYAAAALAEAEKTSSKALLCECYFKYALILDGGGNTNAAIKYYIKCLQTSNDVKINEYAAAAYSNLAEISMDGGNISAAKMYYEYACSADKQLGDYESLYYCCVKLAGLYKQEKPEKAHELLVSALGAAKQLDDTAYLIPAYTEIGDFYAEQSRFKQALKSYILVKTLAPVNDAGGLQDKINKKINKIKLRIGGAEFLRLMNEIKKKK